MREEDRFRMKYQGSVYCWSNHLSVNALNLGQTHKKEVH